MSIDVNEIADHMESEWVDTNAGTHFRGESGDTITKQMWREAAGTTRTGASLRTAALMALGGKCSCCGERDWNVLDIDHINGDGKDERRAGAKEKMERSIVKNGGQGKYQVLCANCHRKKTARDRGYDRNKYKPS